MCGFCGLISNSAEVDISLVSAMLEPLAQRGPDAAGLYAQQNLALGVPGATSYSTNSSKALATLKLPIRT